MSDEALKPVHWIASSLEDVRTFPRGVQRAVGYSLFRAQEGKKAPDAKPFKGIVKGAGVLEIVEDHDTDTYRVVYTVHFAKSCTSCTLFRRSRRGVGQHPNTRSR